MKPRRYFGVELLAVLKNKKVLIPVLAVVLVPLLYSTLFLWAFWDPYAKLDSLPVAIVNEDLGVTYEGKELNIGEEFIDKIQTSKSFNWHIVTQEEALQGLNENKYYLGVEIPEDFSSKAMNVLDEHPVPASLRFYPNESYNFLSSQIGKTAVERMKEELSHQLTKSYTETVFANIHTLSAGLSMAADGAQKLTDGTKSLELGIEVFGEKLALLEQGTITLEDGTHELQTGTMELSGGIAQLKQGSVQLSAGVSQLYDGHNQLADGAKQAEAGTVQLMTGLERSAAAASELSSGANGLWSGLEQYAALHPELSSDAAYMKLMATAKAVAGGTDSLASGQKQLTEGAARLLDGERKLSSSMDIFAVKLGEAKQGSQVLAEGASRLEEGGLKLEAGMTKLSGGAAQLSAGTKQLEDGANRLIAGALTVADGTGELSGKLKEAADKTSTIQGSDELYSKVADPVEVQEEKLHPVPNYGTGFTPYFVSLGLFVGALLLTIVFPLRDPAGLPKSGSALFFGKTGMLLLVGTIQAVIVDAMLLYGLGIEVQNIPLFFLFSLITSWTYMALIQLLVTTLGDPGRFVAIVILILQLTTSAGTFPVELIPDALQKVNVWLPMTYSVSGFKAVISSGDFHFLWRNAASLGSFALLSAAITFIYFIVRHKRQETEAQLSVGAAV